MNRPNKALGKWNMIISHIPARPEGAAQNAQNKPI